MTEDRPGRVRHHARLHTVPGLLEPGLLLLLDLLLQCGHRGVDLVLLGLRPHTGGGGAGPCRAGGGEGGVQPGHDLVSLCVCRPCSCRHALHPP